MDKASKQKRHALRNLIIQRAPKREAIHLALRDGTVIKLRNCLTYKPAKLRQEAAYRVYWQKKHYGIIKLFYPKSQHLLDALVLNELYGYTLAKRAKLYIPQILDMGPLDDYDAYYVLYQYLPHQHFCFSDGNLQKLIDVQKKMFAANLVQYDNHVRNYLLTPKGTAIVDFATIQTYDSTRYSLKIKQYIASVRMLSQALHHISNSQTKKITCQHYLGQLHGLSYQSKAIVTLTLSTTYLVTKLRNISQILNRKWPNTLLTSIMTVVTRECHTKLCQLAFAICFLIKKHH